jgi:hypothetical protein
MEHPVAKDSGLPSSSRFALKCGHIHQTIYPPPAIALAVVDVSAWTAGLHAAPKPKAATHGSLEVLQG